MLVEHADPQPDPAVQDGTLDLVGRQDMDVDMRLTSAVLERR